MVMVGVMDGEGVLLFVWVRVLRGVWLLVIEKLGVSVIVLVCVPAVMVGLLVKDEVTVLDIVMVRVRVLVGEIVRVKRGVQLAVGEGEFVDVGETVAVLVLVLVGETVMVRLMVDVAEAVLVVV
jgi:hypothetical protein